MQPPVDRVRALWSGLAGPGASFHPGPGLRPLVTGEAAICPPGWCGVVTVGGEHLATAPDARRAALLAQTPVTELPGLATEVLGPAHLAYLAGPPAVGPSEPVPTDRPVDDLLAACPAADVEEAGLADASSPTFVVLRAGRPVAAAAYERWAVAGDSTVAHLCVLTDPAFRGRGLARVVAAAASAHADADGLLCQWRARPAASLRVARALGYSVLGSQLSLLIP
ncbi:GNAT family N-acetyltransferase [Kineococcus sp. NPDC059986]|uniref:GNAT family N-acetyltransferase n=1 Tax=Kineococcus sp. NPDC059986 TaxID=3155538 RepID=UPI00345031C5